MSLLIEIGACAKTSDEDRIKAMIRKALHAANERDASGVLADAAPTFLGPTGADLQECTRILLGWFSLPGHIRAFEQDLLVLVAGDQARATLTVIIARWSEVNHVENLLPTDTNLFQFSLALEKVDGVFEFVSAGFMSTPLAP